MTLHISVQGVITAAAFVAAILALSGYVFRARDWVRHQDGQDRQNSADIETLKCHHDEDIQTINSELQLLTYGILSCLKGLQEKGCNGPVTEAIGKIEKHLNAAAHHHER